MPVKSRAYPANFMGNVVRGIWQLPAWMPKTSLLLVETSTQLLDYKTPGTLQQLQ
jgi:hypothetical protein